MLAGVETSLAGVFLLFLRFAVLPETLISVRPSADLALCTFRFSFVVSVDRSRDGLWEEMDSSTPSSSSHQLSWRLFVMLEIQSNEYRRGHAVLILQVSASERVGLQYFLRGLAPDLRCCPQSLERTSPDHGNYYWFRVRIARQG